MSDSGAVVMIVEDDDVARAAIASNLRARGHEVDEASDVREALRLWDSRRPDLILLDLGLPDLDGQAVILRVRREATTPIIVVSARGREEDRVAALDAGADDYLTKPFGLSELHARMRAVLRRAAGPAADALAPVPEAAADPPGPDQEPAGRQPPTTAGPADSAAGTPLERATRAWPRVLERAQQAGGTLSALLRDTQPLAVDGDQVTVGVVSSFACERLREQGSGGAVADALADILGRPVQVHYEAIAAPPAKPAAAPALTDAQRIALIQKELEAELLADDD